MVRWSWFRACFPGTCLVCASDPRHLICFGLALAILAGLMAPSCDDSRTHLESDGEQLVAGGDFGFRRWTGSAWVEAASPLEGTNAWTLYQGTLAATG